MGHERTNVANLGLRDRSCRPTPLYGFVPPWGEDRRDVCPLASCHDIVRFGQPSRGQPSRLCFSSGEKGLVIGGEGQCAYKVEVGVPSRR
ncbi:unnamed protein product [Camellia sinensis]